MSYKLALAVVAALLARPPAITGEQIGAVRYEDFKIHVPGWTAERWIASYGILQRAPVIPALF